ncbi:hypothetical protein EDB81DRAFT_304762 [Dactylonectria macrodidyma]|uniref:Uncharacterized protein n=1 Tax=Dactylonectria macrodidyma TaxID=307937 RepID=A0A9P9D863_9HYPO|nr:hypothetical protein EDB81DRAFT_304762 [Dactylonectria macrodidyma]
MCLRHSSTIDQTANPGDFGPASTSGSELDSVITRTTTENSSHTFFQQSLLMPPKKRQRLRNGSGLDSGSHQHIDNPETIASHSTDVAAEAMDNQASTTKDLPEKTNKKTVSALQKLKKQQSRWRYGFDEESIEVVSAQIHVATKDQTYKFNGHKGILELGDTQPKLPWILYLLYGCVCLFEPKGKRDDSKYLRREEAKHFVLVMNRVATRTSPTGLLIYTLYASEFTRQISEIELIEAVSDYRLSDVRTRSCDIRQSVADHVASGFGLALTDAQIDTADLDKINVVWLPKMLRLIKPSKDKDEVCKVLQLPDFAGISVDSPFVKFGVIKSLLPTNMSPSQPIAPERSSVPEHSGQSVTSPELRQRDKSPSQPSELECSSVHSPLHDERSITSTTSKELQGWDELLSQLVNSDCFPLTSPLHGKHYMSFPISKELQEKASEAGRLQEECNRPKTGHHLGREYQCIQAKWGKLHDAVRDQALQDLVSIDAALY